LAAQRLNLAANFVPFSTQIGRRQQLRHYMAREILAEKELLRLIHSAASI
jgi:hypothetical protein